MKVFCRCSISMIPLLKNPKTKWDRPAVTTCGARNHGIQSKRWRYITYEDGSEELYDHDNDPHEWINVSDNPKYQQIKKNLIKWKPKKSIDGPDINKKEYRKITSKLEKRQAVIITPDNAVGIPATKYYGENKNKKKGRKNR